MRLCSCVLMCGALPLCAQPPKSSLSRDVCVRVIHATSIPTPIFSTSLPASQCHSIPLAHLGPSRTVRPLVEFHWESGQMRRWRPWLTAALTCLQGQRCKNA